MTRQHRARQIMGIFAYPLSSRARHERGYAKIPIIKAPTTGFAVIALAIRLAFILAAFDHF